MTFRGLRVACLC